MMKAFSYRGNAEGVFEVTLTNSFIQKCKKDRDVLNAYPGPFSK